MQTGQWLGGHADSAPRAVWGAALKRQSMTTPYGSGVPPRMRICSGRSSVDIPMRQTSCVPFVEDWSVIVRHAAARCDAVTRRERTMVR